MGRPLAHGMKRVLALVAAPVMLLATPGAPVQAEPRQTTSIEGDVQAFRRLRAEGVAAAGAGDLELAATRLAEADARLQNHPGLILMRARVAAARGRPGDALDLVRRYAAAGLSFDLERDRALSALSGEPGYAEAAEALMANRAPVGAGRLRTVATLDGPVIAETVLRDGRRSRWLVSLVRGRSIVSVDDDGAIGPLLSGEPDIGAVIGLALDPAADVLWAATAPLAPAVHGRPEADPALPPALLRIDPATGAIRGRYGAPPGVAAFDPGDLVRAPDGTIYVADSTGGAIYRLAPGAAALEVWLPAGQLGSPQGMVATPDGAALLVADYSSGLWRIDRRTGAATRLPAPETASLVGLDGLTADASALYAVQNGVAPHRVLRLTLDDAGRRITNVQVLAANLPQLDAPTTVLVQDGELVLVARSQWTDFAADGAQTIPDPAPAILARLALD
jgi:hypothetical protein